ncbi:MAG: glycosyltransferase [Holosporaceae bacterium]|jgi:hypothetical protein|nr:glycosyltransferase [Holosporaceae bacterium]
MDTTVKQSLVSVVIPTYNRKQSVVSCLDSLFKSDYKNIEIIIAIISFLIINACCYLLENGFHINFIDTDDYMRLVRLRDFFTHRDLSNTVISRSNVPFGCDLHWTLFYDFFIIIPVGILNLFTSSIDKSIEYAGFFITPVINCIAAIFIFQISQDILKKENAFVTTMLFLAHPLLLPNCSFGRPDHHAFIMLFMIIFLRCVLNLIKSDFCDSKKYGKLAVVSSLCVWISPETLIPLLLTDGILFICTIHGLGKLENLFFKNISISCWIGVIIVVLQIFCGGCDFRTLTLWTLLISLFATATSSSYASHTYIANVTNVSAFTKIIVKNIAALFWIIALTIVLVLMKGSSLDFFAFLLGILLINVIYVEMICCPRFSHIVNLQKIFVLLLAFFMCTCFACQLVFPVEYDKISSVHLALYLCSAIFFWLNALCEECNTKYRVVYAFICGVIVVSVFLSMYPKFFSGMEADISDYVKKIWLYEVGEMKSPLEQSDIKFFITYASVTAIFIYYKIIELLKNSFSQIHIFWWIIIANSVCYTILASLFYRMIPYSVVFGLPIIASICLNGGKFASRFLRIAFMLSIPMVFLCCMYSDKDKATKYNKVSVYTKQELYAEIDKLSEKPVVIMALIDDGPEILYYTKHCVVGAPYHRQYQGIISSYKVMEDEYDEKTVKNILHSTNSSYIFIRKSKYRLNKPREKWNLANMIINGAYPKWISVVKFPNKFNDVIIAKINQRLL